MVVITIVAPVVTYAFLPGLAKQWDGKKRKKLLKSLTGRYGGVAFFMLLSADAFAGPSEIYGGAYAMIAAYFVQDAIQISVFCGGLEIQILNSAYGNAARRQKKERWRATYGREK